MNREKNERNEYANVQTSPGPPSRALCDLAHRISLPSLTITAGPGLRKFALASISNAAHAGSRANRRANNGDGVREKANGKRYFEVETRKRCLRMSFRCLFRSLRLLIAHNCYRNPAITGEIV